MPVQIYDISEYQGVVDPVKAKARGIQAAIVRSSIGVRPDKLFPANYPSLTNVLEGRTGLYHAYWPTNDAITEANYWWNNFLKIITPRMNPTVDVEITLGLQPAYLRSWLWKFVDSIQQRIQRLLMIYTRATFWDPIFGDDHRYSDNPLYVAHWAPSYRPDLPLPWDELEKDYGHQYSADRPPNNLGEYYGVPGTASVDLGRWYCTLERFDELFPPQGTVPVPQPDTQSFIVTAQALYSRSGPGTKYPVTGSLSQGDVITAQDVDIQQAWVHHSTGWSCWKTPTREYMKPIEH